MRFKLLVFILILPLAGYASNSMASEETVSEDRHFVIPNIATYKENGRISENAKAECELEKSIPEAIEKFAQKFDIKISLAQDDDAGLPHLKRVSLEISDLVAGTTKMWRSWVVSEVGVTVSIKDSEQELAGKYFSCSAGLGVGINPFANFKACERLARCSEQIGAKIDKWLSSVNLVPRQMPANETP